MLVKSDCSSIVTVAVMKGADNPLGSLAARAIPAVVPAAPPKGARLDGQKPQGTPIGAASGRPIHSLDKHIHIEKMYLYVYVCPVVGQK